MLGQLESYGPTLWISGLGSRRRGGRRPELAAGKVKSTGLTQNSQVDPAVWLKIPIRAVGLTQILGQPCEFQAGVGRRLAVGLRGVRVVRPGPARRLPAAARPAGGRRRERRRQP